MLKEQGICQIKNAKRGALEAKQNGAAYSGCAEPHENSNLTVNYQTGEAENRSNGNEENAWD